MAWLSQWKLGRPGAEQTFDTNAAVLEWTPRRVADFRRGLDGSGIDLTASRNRPTFHLSGNFVTPAMRKTLESLIMVDDTPLIFRPFDLTGALMWESIQEWVYPMSLTQLRIPPNSYLEAARVLAGVGAPTTVQMVGVWQTYAPDSESGSGTNYLYPVIYTEGFEGMILGDIVGQDSWVLLGGDPWIRMNVENADVIAGTKSLRWENPTLVNPTQGYQIRRIIPAWLTSPSYVFRMKIRANTITSATNVYAVYNDLLQGMFRLSFLTATSGQFAVTFYVGGGPIGSQLGLPGGSTVHDVIVTVSPGAVTATVDGLPLGTWAGGQVAVDRLVIASTCGGGGYGPFASGHTFDEFSIVGTPGAYDLATRILTLGASLPVIAPCFVSYKASAAAVRAALIPLTVQGGWLDTSKYDLDGEGM